MSAASDRQATEAARIVEAVAAQRELVARHLHDEAVQSVSVAALRVELVRAAAGPGAAEEVDELRDVLRAATLQIRAVMDALRRPPVGDGELARSLRERLAAAGGPVNVVDDLVRDPPEPVALVLHWAAEECVRALRQRSAGGAISVALKSSAGGFALEIVGVGPEGKSGLAQPPEGAARTAAIIGGSVTADPGTPGITRLAVRVPWD